MDIYINKNEPICGCDGTINIYTVNGYPPYTYSIDGGVTFKNFPIFNDLCYGLYSVVVNDVSGNTSSTSIELFQPPLPTQYSIYLNKNEKITSDNGITKTIVNELTISVLPELPNGSYITFDLIHTNSFKCSPTFSAASLVTNSVLLKNSLPTSISYSGISTGTTINTYPGCQNELVYLSTYSETWSDLQINSTDNYSLSTSSSITQNDNVNCYYSDNLDSYSVSNLKIFNCSCCSVLNI